MVDRRQGISWFFLDLLFMDFKKEEEDPKRRGVSTRPLPGKIKDIEVPTVMFNENKVHFRQ